MTISRRDFVAGAAGIGLLSGSEAAAFAAPPTAPAATPTDYPPAKTGMRGSHPGSFEAAHALRDGDLAIGDARDSGETYDLVIVGGGLSGLAAAHYFIKAAGSDVRVLILDNHDDFGGHAKRNEFQVDGRLLVCNGGTLNIESPARYDRWSKALLADIGVDLDLYAQENASNRGLYQSLGLKRGFFLDKASWGRDALVKPADDRGLAKLRTARFPLSAGAQADLDRLLGGREPDYLAGKSVDQKKALLAATSYKEYLLTVARVDPQLYWFFQTTGMPSFCVGGDAVPALFAWVMGLPGFSGLGLGAIPDDLFADLPGGQHGRQKESGESVHFPDGNATLARLLLAKLNPDAIDGRTQPEMGLAGVRYDRLDRKGDRLRLRLNSLVVNVRHDGDAATAREAIVTYVAGGKAASVRGRAVILACWNMAIPYLMPELPAAQREALHYGVKGPLVYTSVAIRNWKAFERLGVSIVESPGMFHHEMGLTLASNLGGLTHPQSPSQPNIVHFAKYMNQPGLPRRDQHRAGRALLLATSLETFEAETRAQMSRILGAGGFDAKRDIAGITVNRWPHGYAYTYNSLYDPLEWVFTESPNRPCVIGRQPHGLVSIANSDAAASPHTDAAFHEAHRAVGEVLERRTFAFVPRA